MTDAASATTPSAAQQPQATPSVQPYDAAQNTSQPQPAMPVPQNSANPIPTAIASPITVSNPQSMMPQTANASAAAAAAAAAGGYVRRAAPEPNKRALYVGGLDQRVTDDVLRQIFETTGHVLSVKIIPDKNHRGLNYGFVEYDDPGAAERAMHNLNGRRVHQSEIRVNWAYQSSSPNKEDTTSHFHIFVGDLSNDVNDDVLLQAFSAFGTLSEARVMWDMKTGRSRGYGFVAFREKADAEKALSSMDGEWLGSRAIRCNWANQKGQPSMAQQHAMDVNNMGAGMAPGMPPFGGHHHFPIHGLQSYDMVVAQTPQWQTTCYVGNLTPYTTQQDLVPLFQNFGYVVETRLQSDRGFAFIKMDTHENAALAICQLNAYNVNGRPLKCSWGKDRPPTMQYNDNYSAQQASAAAAAAAAAAGFNAGNPYFHQFGNAAGAGTGPLSAGGPNANVRAGWDNPQNAGPGPAGFGVPGGGPMGAANFGGRGGHHAHQSNAVGGGANVVPPSGVMSSTGWGQPNPAAAAFTNNFGTYQQG
ncbi:hypothetical protein KEM56_006470 [Ascosphaera pollenicola]|nr:hypothetical protein KEM56_006470 [Ascosphaera pollenicola]